MLAWSLAKSVLSVCWRHLPYALSWLNPFAYLFWWYNMIPRYQDLSMFWKCVVTFCVTYTITSTIQKYGADPNAPKQEEEEDPFAGFADDDDEPDEPEIYELKDLRKLFFPTPADYEPPRPIGAPFIFPSICGLLHDHAADLISQPSHHRPPDTRRGRSGH